jgi:hypothetical protein
MSGIWGYIKCRLKPTYEEEDSLVSSRTEKLRPMESRPERSSLVMDSRRTESPRVTDSRAMDSRSRCTDMARRWCSMKLCMSSSELKQQGIKLSNDET